MVPTKRKSSRKKQEKPIFFWYDAGQFEKWQKMSKKERSKFKCAMYD